MSLKKQTLWSMLPLLVVTVVNIVSVPLFYRFLGPEKYALWMYVLTFTGIFGFMDLGLGVAVGRYIGVALGKADHAAVREYWGTGNVIAIPLLGVMAAVFIFAGVGFGPRWFNVTPSHAALLRWSFVAGGIGLFLSYYSQFWLILSQAHLDFRFLGIVRTAIALLQILPAIPLAWATGNPLLLIGWTCAVAALQLGIFVWHARRSYGLGLELPRAARRRAREMATYTGKTFAALIVNSVFGSLDRLVLGKLAPPAQFTHYTISTNVGGRLQGLSSAMMGPVFSNTNRSLGAGASGPVAAIYNQTFAFVFPWYLLVAIWGALWHPILLRLWLGTELGAAVAPVFTPVLIGCCITAIAGISAAQLSSLNRMGTCLLFTIATTILLTAGVYAGWRWGGLVGVGWGFLASRIPLIAQDLYVIHAVRAGGWLAPATWSHGTLQAAVAATFSVVLLFIPRDAWWNLVPAVLHGAVVATYLLRGPLRRMLAGALSHARSRPA
ncbi:MAG: oligosaccharide flippase family protein [Verrucomicrobia bacterium]|nr:oligosaccharide flippase family protein [Verrucomicrobiota bacterium]